MPVLKSLFLLSRDFLSVSPSCQIAMYLYLQRMNLHSCGCIYQCIPVKLVWHEKGFYINLVFINIMISIHQSYSFNILSPSHTLTEGCITRFALGVFLLRLVLRQSYGEFASSYQHDSLGSCRKKPVTNAIFTKKHMRNFYL